jgi:hypothetical protein
MNTTINHLNEFIIGYDYFGLSGTALVTPTRSNAGVYFNCKLLETNDSINILYKKEAVASFWIDRDLNIPTPLSLFIGQAIENEMESLEFILFSN